MFRLSILPLSLLALLATSALTGCMDEDRPITPDDGVMIVEIDGAIVMLDEDGEIIELDDEDLAALELELDDPAPEPWDDTGADEPHTETETGAIDDIATPPPGPCEPNEPPLGVEAPELPAADDDDGSALPPPPLVIEAPDFLDEEDHDDSDDDSDDDGDGDS